MSSCELNTNLTVLGKGVEGEICRQLMDLIRLFRRPKVAAGPSLIKFSSSVRPHVFSAGLSVK